MLKHLLSFVSKILKIPVEVGILSKNKNNPRRRSPIYGIVSTQTQTLIGWKGKHIKAKRKKTLQAGLFICLTFGQYTCEI